MPACCGRSWPAGEHQVADRLGEGADDQGLHQAEAATITPPRNTPPIEAMMPNTFRISAISVR
jgi:hypothetical protein